MNKKSIHSHIGHHNDITLDDKVFDFNIQCKDIQYLDISMRIMLLSFNHPTIMYHKKSFISNVIKTIRIPQSNQIKLSLDKVPLISCCKHNNWILSIKKSASNGFILCLHLLLLPSYIQKINVRISINVPSVKNLTTCYGWATQKKVLCYHLKQQSASKCIIVTVDIEKVFIYGNNNNVSKQDWYKYNIVP